MALGTTLLGRASARDDAAIGAHQTLELRRGGVARQRQQFLLLLDLLHARERTDLRIAQPPIRKRRPDQRQLLEPVRDAQMLTRRHQRDPAAPRHTQCDATA